MLDLHSFEDVAVFLRVHEIKPSLQRVKIYEFLANSVEHPNVDTIYRNLAGEIPTLSKTTVYNTLNLFIDKGIVNVVTIEENECRYDADISLHGHFKCQECGELYDVEVETVKVKSGHKVVNQDVYLRGICESCLQAKEERNGKKK